MKICLSCGNRFKSSGWECPVCHYKPEEKSGYPLFAPELAEFNTGFDARFFSQLARVEPQNFWFRARNRLLTWALGHYFPGAKNFFEIGCGTGFVLSGVKKAFPGIALYGAEIFSTGLDYAADRLSVADLFQMDARCIPFENEFDIIGAFDVLEHIEDDRLVLSQIHQAIRYGGGVMLTVPQHTFLWGKTDEYACHVRRYNARELKIKIEKTGFKVIRITSFVSLLLPLMLISRLINRRPKRKNDITAELQIGGPANVILEKILDMERYIIRMGLSFPAGGSLLIIARKV